MLVYGRYFLSMMLFVLPLFSISSASLGDPKNGGKTAKPSKIPVVNLKQEFRAFWGQAKAKSADERLQLWDKLIEAPHQVFYDSVVWDKKNRPDWQEIKKTRLLDYFKRYETSFDSISASFDRFETTLASRVAAFQGVLPDARVNITVYAVPSPMFNGKVARLGGLGAVEVLAFGIDQIVLRSDDIDSLFSHELFHVYHRCKLRLNTDEGSQLTLPLFEEGLATYASGIINPGKGDAVLLASQELASIGPGDLNWLLQKFREQAKETVAIPGKPETYKTYLNWFGGRGNRIREDLPHRCGYLLGLRVIRHLSKTSTLQEMVKWKIPEIQRKVLLALEEMAKQKVDN